MLGAMNMLKKMKIFRISAIILLIGSIITIGISVYAFSPSDPLPFFDPEVRDYYFVGYQANEISKPLWYWKLTDPDATILEAIRKSSIPEIYDPELDILWEHWTDARTNETTFIYQVFFEHEEVWEIEYEGHYYCVDAVWYVDPQSHTNPNRIGLPIPVRIHNARHEKELAVGLAPVFSVAWIALGLVWIKKKPTA